MRNLIYIFLITLFFGCKNKHKEINPTVSDNGPVVENITSTENNKTDYQHEIIPGKRLGNIILNENSTAVKDSLGKPDSGDAAMGKAVATWHQGSKDQLSIYTTTQMGVEDFSRIKAIRTLSPDYKTNDNLAVDSTLDEIEINYKLNKVGDFTSEDHNYILYSTVEGIGFEIGEDGKCHGIVLTEKGTEPQQLYLTFYPDLKKAN
ncbi:hypothetical protein EI546_14240 [Aequorivita sp. H23M31]|uniref:Lipoprotein n=1 Tax=Aequorivita ciconiae TaxID=2494375 RepID=A0A410G6J4_9FLAO|nr:hypothetical protein [Aequorivita sp. H23M31]QAA82805.1 hypothetical protein EI546_14240 [Aequorivita sp. H23M31]